MPACVEMYRNMNTHVKVIENVWNMVKYMKMYVKRARTESYMKKGAKHIKKY